MGPFSKCAFAVALLQIGSVLASAQESAKEYLKLEAQGILKIGRSEKTGKVVWAGPTHQTPRELLPRGLI